MVEKKRAAFDELEGRLNDGIDKCATARSMNTAAVLVERLQEYSITPPCVQSARLGHWLGARSVRR